MIRTFDGVALSFWHSKDSSSPPGTGILKRSIKIQTHSQYLNTHNFSSLNGLRGLSIVAVVAFHCQCFVYGNLGVNLFFVISGFLITTLLLREKLKYSAISLKCFYVRRALRIFPLYFTVVLVYVLVVYLAEGKSRYAQVFWGNLPYFLTYTSNWFVDLNSGPKVIFYFAWSLAAEEQFYSTWPFIEKYLSEKNILVATVFLFIASQTCQFIAANYFTKVPLIINILSKIPAEILGGVVLAHCLNSPRPYAVWERAVGNKSASVIAMFALALVVFCFPGVIIFRKLMIVLAMVVLVASCVISEDNYLAKILQFQGISYIGVISYGIYLTHMLCKGVSMKLLPMIGVPPSNVSVFAVTLLSATLVSGLSYRYYEQSFLRLKNRYVRK